MVSSLFQNNQQINPSNPQLQAVKQFLATQNLTAEQAVRKICKERGIDVESFLRSIK